MWPEQNNNSMSLGCLPPDNRLLFLIKELRDILLIALFLLVFGRGVKICLPRLPYSLFVLNYVEFFFLYSMIQF